ncbi:MAG: DNA-3-methyladenine glycosylase 2 family protein [Kofleriaceae bacterium]|nr:DNA-3-methyladenine glycosylase 2 family protein [Kofleriaceae bacterium]
MTRRYGGSVRPRRDPELSFTLRPVVPFRLDLTAWALQRRANNEIDRWDGHAYERAFVVDGRALDVSVTQGSAPVLRVIVRGETARSSRKAVTSILRRVLGLQIDLAGFYRLAHRDRHLESLAGRFRGLKPPRFPSVFEAVVNGIACQQLSLTVGILLLGRLSRLCGLPSPTGAHAFPRPSDITALRPAQLRTLGFNHNKARALLEVSHAVEDGFDLEALADLDNDAVVERLVSLRGIGRWTAEYVLLRGLGRLTMFPGDDVGARTNLARWMKLRTPLDYARVRQLARRWEPYPGFLYFHLLLQALDEAGELDARS